MIPLLNAADGATGAPAQSTTYALLMNLAPFILIFIVFYFLLIRPQKKKQQAHRLMIESLKSGDKVLLNSGITGVVSSIKDENYLMIKIADNVEVEVLRSYVANVLK